MHVVFSQMITCKQCITLHSYSLIVFVLQEERKNRYKAITHIPEITEKQIDKAVSTTLVLQLVLHTRKLLQKQNYWSINLQRILSFLAKKIFPYIANGKPSINPLPNMLIVWTTLMKENYILELTWCCETSFISSLQIWNVLARKYI